MRQQIFRFLAAFTAVVVPLLVAAGQHPVPATDGLSDAQLAGQHIIYSYPGLTPPPELIDKVRAGEVGGVIFFAENVSSAEQLAGVSAELRQAASESPIARPLLLVADQEGGQVRRVPGGPEQSARQMGDSPDPVAAATAGGSEAAAALAAGGLNGNLAPVVDVSRADGDFVDQYGRGFSHDPAAVGADAAAFVAAQRSAGIVSTLKHFPGLGSAPTSANTDLRPVTIDTPADELRSIDEAPYRQAIDAGAEMVMPSWAIYPALDAERPAGLSPTIIGDELRGRLGFTGVTVSDALEAGSLKPFGDTGQLAVLANNAGMDIITCSARSMAQGDEAAAALVAGLADGSIDRAAFLASTERILTMDVSPAKEDAAN